LLVNRILNLAREIDHKRTMDHKPNEQTLSSRFSWRRLITAELILAVVMALILGIAAYFGSQRSGAAGVSAALVAFLVCWIPNALSLLIMGFVRDPQLSVSAMLFSMLFRMAVPMVFAIFLLESKHWLAGAGALSMVLIFYLVALAVETPLSLWLIRVARDPVVKVL
jgi:hypothetical protein